MSDEGYCAGCKIDGDPMDCYVGRGGDRSEVTLDIVTQECKFRSGCGENLVYRVLASTHQTEGRVNQ